MTSPEEALERARSAAAAARAAGRYDPPAAGPLEETFVGDAPELDELAEWAKVEVEPEVLYSTRRFGGPVTAVKRLLLRLLRQYHVEVEAQLTRFNTGVLARLRLLEERVERLEHADRE